MSKIENIRKVVYNMSRDVEKNSSLEYIRSKYGNFEKESPKLFQMVLENSPSYKEILERMMLAAESVEKGEVTLKEMDKTVGMELAKEYVYPLIDMNKENI